MTGALFIDGRWRHGAGSVLRSVDPATGAVVWEGVGASADDCAAAVAAARAAFRDWGDRPRDDRLAVVRRFREVLLARAEELARDLSRETGKALWETRAEVASMAAKVEVSIAADAERTGSREQATGFGRAVLRHRPHGVMAVLGPFNFPGHLPNGHIVPALIAGDTVVFKPSEETPLAGARMAACWEAAGLPPGVFNLVQADRETGAALLAQRIDGLLFTGSATAGRVFRRLFVDRPEVTLALELGGDNPLVVWDAGDPAAVAALVVQSAFVTTGQRCSCARRLILPEGRAGDAVVEAVVALMDRLRIGAWDDAQEPFMGPLISVRAAAAARGAVEGLQAAGAATVRPFSRPEGLSDAFVTPALLDVNGAGAADEEIFAPVLQVRRSASFEAAVGAANATRFGLSAGLVSEDPELWRRFLNLSRAGVVNWNRPTTGAAAAMPFGGLGESGNGRPGAYYAADYCAYPVASFEADAVRDTTGEIKGLEALSAVLVLPRSRGRWRGAQRRDGGGRADFSSVESPLPPPSAVPLPPHAGEDEVSDAVEANADGLIGPTHSFAGLATGNLASAANEGLASNPRAAALQGLAKMARLAELGLPQFVLPPHERPDVRFLRRLGFVGPDARVLVAAARDAPALLAAASSASAMWAANAATVTPSADARDARVHLTPANLVSNLHRSLEPDQTGRALRALLPDPERFVVHDPLPAQSRFADEGAANHVRLAAPEGGEGVELFVWGREGGELSSGRQTDLASQALARRHGVRRPVWARQSARAVAAGAFHNDVVCVGAGACLFHHEAAFAEPERMRQEVRRAADGLFEPVFVEVSEAELSLDEAIRTYLFNAMLVRPPGEDRLVLLAPVEVRDSARARAVAERIVAGNGPIGRVDYVDVRESMRNGGGPACLRLRLSLTPDELAAANPAQRFDAALHARLYDLVRRRWRDRLLPGDLADPALLDESRAALDELTEILGLGGGFYPFQR